MTTATRDRLEVFAEEEHFPVGGTPEEQLRFLQHYAALAPSLHDARPWTFDIEGDDLELYVDRSRSVHELDPQDRELTLSCGAALFNLRVAINHFGLMAHVDRLPEAPPTDLLARVTLTGPTADAATGDRLFDAIPERRMTLRAFGDREVPVPVTVDLEVAARRHGAELVAATSPRAIRAVGDLITDAEGAEADADPRLRSRGRRLAEAAPLVAFIVTDRDGPRDWLAAGEALANILLEAEASGVAAAFVNQPLEDPERRSQLREALRVPGFPQAGIRFGYALVR